MSVSSTRSNGIVASSLASRSWRLVISDFSASSPLSSGFVEMSTEPIDITLPFLGADGWANNRITQAVKDNAFYSVHFNAGDPRLTFSAQTFVDNFQTQFGMPPGSRAALGYDAVRIYARAVEGGENLSTEQIRQRLSQTSNYAGATEILRLDQSRNPIKSAVIMKIEDRVEAFHQSVIP